MIVCSHGKFDGKGSPRLSISVCNAQGKAIEPERTIDSPALIRTDAIWWGYTWYMQTPIQNIGDDFCIVVRLHYGKVLADQPVLTARYHIDKEKVDSGKTVFSFSSCVGEPEFADVKNKRMSVAASKGVPLHREPTVENLMEAEIEITKCFRKIDLDKIVIPASTKSKSTSSENSSARSSEQLPMKPQKPGSAESSLRSNSPMKPKKPLKPTV